MAEVSGLFLVNEQIFRDLFQKTLGTSWHLALAVFLNYRDYGDAMAYEVTNALQHAVDQDKVDEVLTVLQQHYEDYLQFHCPEISDTVKSNVGTKNSPTDLMFRSISSEILRLKAVQ